MDIKLELVPEPDPKKTTVLQWAKTKDEFDSFMNGGGIDNLLCGQCDAALCKNVNSSSIQNIHFKCPFCEKFNLKR